MYEQLYRKSIFHAYIAIISPTNSRFNIEQMTVIPHSLLVF